MRWIALWLALSLALAGCVTSPEPEQPRTQVMSVVPDEALREAATMLAEQGYVIRYADVDLGRIDAERLGRPPYRLRLEITEQAQGALVSFSGRQGARPIDPASFDPLLAELRARLELSP
ncbi:hypothetical protein [Aidingimonas lacisalsi]|uniref:hypothetical protein n=1 Tax=Aidingimonas lacisalsi TaxID=2604086 RepID=UPI0011D1D5B6|nr:hypothetical protein [Aidingimonas lacisalsi]